MTAHLRSKGHLLTPALKKVWRTRAECLLQWHAANGHENILFTDEKFFTSRSSITTRTTRYIFKCPLRCILSVQGCHHTSYVMVCWGVSHQGVTHLHFYKKGVKLVSECFKRTCYKEFRQLNVTLFSGQEWIFQQDSVPAQKPRRLRSSCGGTFRPLSAPRIDPRGVQTSTPGTINYGLFWRTWLAKIVTTTWTVWRDPSWKQRQRSPWRRCVPQ